MRKFKEFVFIIWFSLISLIITGCGIGLDDSIGPNQDRLRKYERIRNEYRPIQGVYEGLLNISGNEDPVNVRLYLFVSEKQGEQDPGDLKPGIQVLLRGRLMEMDSIGDSDNLILTGQYDSNTGRLFLEPDESASRTSSGCRLGGQEQISLDARVNSKRVTGTVRRYGQHWAQLDVRKVEGADVSEGAVLDERQDYARIEAFYRPIVGTYRGDIKREMCGEVNSEQATLLLYLERVKIGENSAMQPCYTPRLRGRFFRNVYGELSDQFFTGFNRYDVDAKELELQAASSSTRLSASFDENDLIQGELYTSGFWGHVSDFEKVSDQVHAPEDEGEFLRERLNNTYRPFAGQYKGHVRPYDSKKKRWPVDLNLFISQERNSEGIQIPILLARYTRPDLSDPSIGARLMNVQVSFDTCQPQLLMRSEARGGGVIPGVGLMRYNAVYDSARKSLSGDLTDHRGPQGELTLEKKK